MGAQHLFLAVAVGLLAASVEAQEAPPTPLPIPTIQGDTEEAPTPKMSDVQVASESDETFWSDPIGTLIEQLFVWLFSPICEPTIAFLDWIGVQGAVISIDLNYGTIGYLLGIADAWAPVHEGVLVAMWFMAIYAVWTPIRFGIKYFLPGIG